MDAPETRRADAIGPCSVVSSASSALAAALR
jgi:hypothetical protein